MSIRFFDMFSGIGGFRSGLEAVGGFECIGHCEIDRHANQAYNAIYQPKGEFYCDDARKINPETMPDFDVLCAGFPCQSFSVAGKRLGFDDMRGTLIFEVARIIAAKRPAFLFLENVPGLLSHDGGRTLDTIFSTLVEMGYHLEWCVHNSKHFGVPQQRRRLYIVGYLEPRCAGQIFPLACGDAQALKQLIPGPQGQRVYETDGIACTQCAGAGGWGGKTGLYFIDMNVNPVITDHARCITARQDSGISNHRGEHSAVLIEDEAPRAILTPDRETVRQQGRRVKEPDEPMFTITAQDRHGVWHRGRIRKFMPVECWRLQGFTDEQFRRAEATGLKDGHLYKMAGNAVSVPVISAIGRKILALNEQYQIIKGSDVKERIEAFNEENRPFYIVDHDDGKFSLCLPLGFISGEYEDFGQKAFDAYALEIGEPPVDSRGFQTHGNGYEWEAAFYQAFEGDPNLRRFAFDCESSGFFMDCDDLSLLEEYGSKFREICMDTERFTPIVSQGIKRMDQWLAEQEKLANTVRGALLENPSSTFDIMTPDGNIRITPQDTKQLLDGDMQFVHIGGAQYCAFELLDQEIVQKQTDLFDEDLIRMKTQEPEQELGFKMTM